ncbi:MAG: pyruvate carboxylase subunit B [Acholeplasmataceae bacterium]
MLKITETSLRDGHQSLLATRLSTSDILKVLPHLDQVGFDALEVWGGATFDACLRFLNEDPWERLKLIKANTKHTKLQMLLRGQNLVGYKHYGDDVVDAFIKEAIHSGIDIIRTFDALNDLRNLRTSVMSTKKYGGHAQVALSYTTSPVHTIEYYIELAKQAEIMGADSICIKDMAGLMLPYTASTLFKQLKSIIKVPIHFHSHATTGMMMATYIKAIEAGIDGIDTALSPLAGGTSQPPTESLYHSLKGSLYEVTLNEVSMIKAYHTLTQIKDSFMDAGMLHPKVLTPNPMILTYQVPGGMLSNLISQLSEQKMLHQLEDVLAEIPNVRKDFGYPPLVTPISQFVGVQSALNVMNKKRYQVVPNEVKDYLTGLYGTSPGPINPEFIKKIIGDEPIITHRPADDIPPSLTQIKNQHKDIISNDTDLLSIAVFDTIAIQFLTRRHQHLGSTLSLNDNAHVFGKKTLRYKRYLHETDQTDIHQVIAPMNAVITSLVVNDDDFVNQGDLLLTLTSEKLNIEILSPLTGVVKQLKVSQGKIVEQYEPLLTINDDIKKDH